MPNYPGALLATVPAASNLSPLALDKGSYAYLFGVLKPGATQLPVEDRNVGGEALSALVPVASIAALLAPASEAAPPPMVAVEIAFSGDPGTFNLQIQEADTDADAFYITPATAVYTVTAVTAQLSPGSPGS